MSRLAFRLSTLALPALLPALLGCPTGGGSSSLSVYPNAFDFGTARTSDSMTVSNAGSGRMTWSIEGLPGWLEASPASGATDTSRLVTLTVDRTGMPPGEYAQEFTVVSGGQEVLALARMVVEGEAAGPLLHVGPASLEFGTDTSTLGLTVSNNGGGTLDWNLEEDIPWLQVSKTSGAVDGGKSDGISVSVDRIGLAAGTHSGALSFTSNGGTATVTVTVETEGPAPRLSISPAALNFDADDTSRLLTLTNAGTAPLDWTIAEDLDWLSLSQVSGTLASGSVNITVTVDRSALATGDYGGTLVVDSNGGAASVAVTLAVAAAELNVYPSQLNFSGYAQSKLLAISNKGVGTVNWSIDTADFPAWLSVNPAAGTATTTTGVVMVTVDRGTLTLGNYTHTFTVQSDAGSADVHVSMAVPPQPKIAVQMPQGQPQPNTPSDDPTVYDGQLELGATNTTASFIIRNAGTGTLDWSFDTSQFEPWFSASPTQGSVTKGINTVTVTVNREGLDTSGYRQPLTILSNGGTARVLVTMQVEPTAAISVDVSSISLGIDSSTAEFHVANTGDPGTLLEFELVEETESGWLLFGPAAGESYGTSGPIKDWRLFNIAVSRENLPPTGGTTTLRARGKGRWAHLSSDPIAITAQPIPLAFEGPLARLRVPSMVRFVFIMRDVHDQAIVATPAALANVFSISEKSIPLEPTETNQFVTGPDKLRANLVVLLDYSGSMHAAAASRTGGDAESLHDTYARVVKNFVDALPAHWRVSLMEFHDRRQPTRVLADFTRDRATLHAAIDGFRLDDYGATELLPALGDAMSRLMEADAPYLDFDNADIRAVVVITDGRMTTPPGNLDEEIRTFSDNRMQIFPIGWGAEVDQEPLARLALQTGGHYYPTVRSGVDNPNTAALEEQAARLAGDLHAQVVLSYTTLREDDSISVRVSGDYDEAENDGIPPAQGSFVQSLDFSGIVGDVRMGQISMHTEGIEGVGLSRSARVYIRADYLPRNIREFVFDVGSTEMFAVSRVPNDAGGIIGHWEGPTLLPDGRIRMVAPAGAEALPYGAFGDLLELEFSNPVADDFGVTLAVDNTVYAVDADPKYFIHPDYIRVDGEPRQAPAFPTPSVEPLFVDFGTADNTRTFVIRNIGGAYPPDNPIIRLNWQLELPGADWLSADVDEGWLGSGLDAQVVTLTADRAQAPGIYTLPLSLTFDSGGFLPTYPFATVQTRMTVTP